MGLERIDKSVILFQASLEGMLSAVSIIPDQRGDLRVFIAAHSLALIDQCLDWISNPIGLTLTKLTHKPLEEPVCILARNEKLVLASLQQPARAGREIGVAGLIGDPVDHHAGDVLG